LCACRSPFPLAGRVRGRGAPERVGRRVRAARPRGRMRLLHRSRRLPPRLLQPARCDEGAVMQQAHRITGVAVDRANREKDDFYPTPPEGTEALLSVEAFEGPI